MALRYLFSIIALADVVRNKDKMAAAFCIKGMWYAFFPQSMNLALSLACTGGELPEIQRCAYWTQMISIFV